MTPAFSVKSAAKVVSFLEQAFGGTLVERYEAPGGLIAHAEILLGDSIVMLGDPMPGSEPRPGTFTYYVDDGEAVDAAYRRALAAGATSVSEPKNQFYGYRSAQVEDMGGNRWGISAVIEQLTPEQIQERMAKLGG